MAGLAQAGSPAAPGGPSLPPAVPAIPAVPAPAGAPDGLSAGSGSGTGASGGALAFLIFAFLIVPGLARLRSGLVVPSTAAILRPHEVPG